MKLNSYPGVSSVSTVFQFEKKKIFFAPESICNRTPVKPYFIFQKNFTESTTWKPVILNI